MKRIYTIASVVALIVFAMVLKSSAVKAYLMSYFTTNQSATATTTLSYMTPGTATTTYQLGVIPGTTDSGNADVDANYLFLNTKSSTSAAVYDFKFQFSNGTPTGTNCITSPNVCDWYDLAIDPTLIAVSQSQIQIASTSLSTYRWQPGNTTSSSSLLTMKVPDISANFKRVVFFMPAGVSTVNGAVWFQDNAKRVGSN